MSACNAQGYNLFIRSSPPLAPALPISTRALSARQLSTSGCELIDNDSICLIIKQDHDKGLLDINTNYHEPLDIPPE